MQNPSHSFLLLLSILTFLISSASADSIHGCGGFVEASSGLIKSRKPGDPKLDYSHITVELRTVDGLVKDRTQCAPNGYYFIPVYDKGSFVLAVKGPEGWSWLPNKVKVLVDNAGCNGNEDINFKFTGFAISGRVVGAVGGESCSRKTDGPANVDIELLSSAGDIVTSVRTSSGGSYLFKDIAPGKYKLHASHPDMKIEVRGSSEVELGFGNSIVDDIFFATGYNIRGSVVAQGNPILGVHVFLYSDDVVELDCPEQTLSVTGQGKALCQTVSDAEGLFMFKSIPCGSYELKPYYKGENTEFDVSPPVLSVLVEHQHVMIPQRFEVTGFSVGGRVLDGNDNGVVGVKIVVDGHERSITDNQGYYKLDQVTSNRYTIEARKEHYQFDMLKDYMVLPNIASIADIRAVSYDVCGTVCMVSAGHKAKVTLTHGPENVKPQMKYTDASGNFCFQVPPGEYRLAALAANPESAPGLLFSPPYTDVVIKSPLLNLEFSQALVNIHGHVDCKDKCGPSVSVSLVRLTGGHGEKKTVHLTDDSNNFIFQDVIPSKYRLEVKHTSLNEKSGEGDWCWERSSVDLDVGAEDVKGVVFTQKGFWINIISTHDVNAFLSQPDGSRVNLNIKKGPQRICVEFPGVHELYFIDSCVFFGSSSVKIDTSNTSPVMLRGEKYLLKGEINVDAHSLHFPEQIILDVVNREGETIDTSIAKKISDGDAEKDTARFEYSLWADIGDKLTFAPRDSRNAGEKKILFYPRQHQVLVESGGCQSSVAPFSGREGLYIKGSVSPPISDVDIKVIAIGESQNAPLRKGETAFETTSAADGIFVAGPLYDDTTYRIEASKPGYHVKQVGPNSFSCQKLGQISVRVYSKDDAKEPIPSVLLSLSGDDGYRNNSVSGAGGTFLFDSLFPGSFYLRPVLKEYAFSPSAEAIELGSGESREIFFEATRVAYSAMGTVASLSRQPKDAVSVEARSVSKGYYEETVTDSSGSFRLRGLLPDTTYTIKVVRRDNFGGTKIERASPESVTLKVGSEDIRGLDFVVFEQPESTILSGHVERQKTAGHPQLLVEIKSANDPSKIATVFPLPLSNFFQVKGLPKSKHLVQLRSEFPSATHKFESKFIEVDLEENSQIHVGPLTYTFEENFNKQDLNAAPLFPLIAGISVIALFASMPRLKDFYQATVGSSAVQKKEVKKPVSRKRVY